MTAAIVVCGGQNAPGAIWVRSVQSCPTCRRRRRFVGWFEEWHGVTWTCCGCGDSWCDDAMLPRPLRRGWRRQAVEKAKQRWRQAESWSKAVIRIDRERQRLVGPYRGLVPHWGER